LELKFTIISLFQHFKRFYINCWRQKNFAKLSTMAVWNFY